MRSLQSVFCVSLLCGLLVTQSAFAQPKRSEQEISQITHEISNEILSPYCPGKTLAMCPSPAAADARRIIQNLATTGLEKSAIKAKIIEQFGEEYQRSLPDQDDDFWVILLVILGGLISLSFIYYLSRKRGTTETFEDDDLLDNDPPTAATSTVSSSRKKSTFLGTEEKFTDSNSQTPPSNISLDPNSNNPSPDDSDPYLSQLRNEYQD